MKVIRKGKDEAFDDMFPGTYEFKLCGGSVEPSDRVTAGKRDDVGSAEKDRDVENITREGD